MGFLGKRHHTAVFESVEGFCIIAMVEINFLSDPSFHPVREGFHELKSHQAEIFIRVFVQSVIEIYRCDRKKNQMRNRKESPTRTRSHYSQRRQSTSLPFLPCSLPKDHSRSYKQTSTPAPLRPLRPAHGAADVGSVCDTTRFPDVHALSVHTLAASSLAPIQCNLALHRIVADGTVVRHGQATHMHGCATWT